MSYQLSCCSTVDLTTEWLKAKNISYICFNYELDGQVCKDDFGKTHGPAELYQLMLNGADAKTSQVSVGEYLTYFEPLLASGQDVVHVTLSSGISGTYNSAATAADQLNERYAKAGVKVYVVDSLCASAGYGLLMDKLAELRDGGMDAEELVAWAEKNRGRVNHWFFSTDLTFFIRGGRISKTAGLAGSLLRICPMMNVSPTGTLEVVEKIRTKSRAINRDVAIMLERADEGVDYTGPVFISQSECQQDAQKLAEQIASTFTQLAQPVRIFDIGATIGCHTGPGTVALFYWGKPRDEE